MKDEWFIICELGHSYSRQSEVPKTCLTCGEKITVAVNFGGVVTPFTLTVDPKGNPAITIRRRALSANAVNSQPGETAQQSANIKAKD